MNKKLQELNTKLEEAKELVKTLELKAKELQGSKPERWRADKNGGEYWHVCADGEATKFNERITHSRWDNFLYSIGNYFKTREEAEKYKNYLIITQKLKDIALRLNNGEKIDWSSSSQRKYSICYSYNYVNGQLCQDMLSNKYFYPNTIYCLSNKFLEIAKKEIGEKELIEYIKES